MWHIIIGAYAFDTEQNKYSVGCQLPGNCSKHRRFGGHVASVDIKHAQRCGSRVRSRDFSCNFRFPAAQWRRVYCANGQLLNFKINFVLIFDGISVLGAVLLTVGRSYVGKDITHSTLLDTAYACSYTAMVKFTNCHR